MLTCRWMVEGEGEGREMSAVSLLPSLPPRYRRQGEETGISSRPESFLLAMHRAVRKTDTGEETRGNTSS